MSAIRGMNAGFFCGMRIGEFSIDFERDVYQHHSFGDEAQVILPGPSRASISLSMLTDNYPENLFDLFSANVYALGEGTVCPYCGDYNPAGLARCHRCGGNTEWRPDARLKQLPFLIDRCDTSAEIEGLVAANISLVSTGRFTMRDASSIIGRDIENDWEELDTEFFWGRTDYYLCQYCGQAVEEGKICPSCGGVRTPWSEILKMDRECVYCGAKVLGGIVCPGCGRRLSGQTLEQQKRRGLI